MAVKVIDASALAAVVFNEPDADRVIERVGGDRLAAPELLRYELASVCLKKLRAHGGRRLELLAAFALETRLEIEYLPVDHQATVALAEATALTTYDASYLWLARSLPGELVTLDKALAAIAR
jgi:predicted nucleic acid-binding protein